MENNKIYLNPSHFLTEYDEKGWPIFKDIKNNLSYKAISPSKVNTLLSALAYGNTDLNAIKWAIKRGNSIEEAFYTYLNYKNKIDHKEAIKIAITKTSNKKQRDKLIKLIYWFNKKFPNANLISYQEIIYKFPYACILDFKFKFKENGEEYIIDLKTNNYKYFNKYIKLMWEIQFYIQLYCSNKKVYSVWITEKDKEIKILNKEYKLTNKIKRLIDYLIYSNNDETMTEKEKLDSLEWFLMEEGLLNDE